MNICLEEAERTDPDHPLVSLVRQISLSYLPPSVWEKIKDGSL